MAVLELVKRKIWKNHIGEVKSEPLMMLKPSKLNEVRAIVKSGYDRGVAVRGIGSGHSWSDVGVTYGYLIEPNKLNKVLDIDQQRLKDGIRTKHLVAVESGIKISKLNEHLDKKGLALTNMGGYDGQTIVGATSTSTHGSGIAHGPLSDMIKSIDIVSKEGKVFRIEPEDGITDPQKYKTWNIGTLIQSDDHFNAVKVGIGCMGVIYSVIIGVRDAFLLQEVRTLSTWAEVKKDLKAKKVFTDNAHYEILINPHPVNGKYDCLVTTRNPTLPGVSMSKRDRKRNFFPELGSSLGIVRGIIFKQFDDNPEKSPKLIKKGIKALKDRKYCHKSFKVYNIGAANDIPSYSSEIALSMRNDKYIEGIDKMLKVIAKNVKEGNLYHSGPIAFRFVKASKAFLSPMYHRSTCMIEVIMMKKTFGAAVMYDSIEKALYPFGARVHWGQINSLNASVVKKMYPQLDRWKEIKTELDPKNIFSNPFSERVGL